MKSFGMIGELDNTGGIKLPDMFMGICEVGAGDDLELRLEGDNIVMRKYPPVCIFCGSGKELREYRNKSYCSECAGELKNYQKT